MSTAACSAPELDGAVQPDMKINSKVDDIRRINLVLIIKLLIACSSD